MGVGWRAEKGCTDGKEEEGTEITTELGVRETGDRVNSGFL